MLTNTPSYRKIIHGKDRWTGGDVTNQRKIKIGDIKHVRPKRPPNKTRRDFSTYNKAAERKWRHFHALLAHLSDIVGLSERKGRGRPQAVPSTILFACVLKVARKLSARELTSELELSYELGLISSVPRWPTVLKYLRDPDMHEFFRAFVTISSLPCRQLETTFCADASGLTTKSYRSWHGQKYGGDSEEAEVNTRGGMRDWVKAHILIGTRTQVIVAADVTDADTHDSTRLPSLVSTAAREYRMEEIAADKGYVSRFNLDLVNDLGAIAYIPFMKHHIVPLTSDGSAWDKWIRYYAYRRDEFYEHYGLPRAEVESAFAVNKALFDPTIRSMSFPAQVNEGYCRFIAHNLNRLIHICYEMPELDIIPDFGVHEPIYHDDVPKDRLSSHPLDAEPSPHRCACNICQEKAHPFFTLPGDMPTDSKVSRQLGEPNIAPTGTDGDYPDNIIYLFGRD